MNRLVHTVIITLVLVSCLAQLIPINDANTVIETTLENAPISASDGYIGGPYSPMPDTGFGVAHMEMILPNQWVTDIVNHYWDPLLHRSALMMRNSSMSWNRFEFAWSYVQPTPDTWDWSTLDAYMNFSDYYGLHILPIVAYGVSWACENGDYLAPIVNMTAWRTYVHALVDRYKDRQSMYGYWQIWNEANIDGFFHGDFVKDFLPIMVAAAEEVKAADPTAKVVANAITSDTMGEIITQMVDGIGRERFIQLFDAVDIHPYASDAEAVAHKIQDAKDALAGWYPGELWITEIGWPINPNLLGEAAESEKAQNIGKTLVKSRAMNVTHTIVHMWCDWGWVNGTPKVLNATYGENWFGIVDQWANPKPSYYAFQTVANAIGTAHYLGVPSIEDVIPTHQIEAPIFETIGGEWVLAVWNWQEKTVPIEISLPELGYYVIYNTTGSAIHQGYESNRIQLEVTSNLLLIHIKLPNLSGKTYTIANFGIRIPVDPGMIMMLGAIPVIGLITIVIICLDRIISRSKKPKN